MIIFDQNLQIFSSTLLNDDNYFSGFGTRMLGDGKKQINNIYRFFESNGINYSKIVIPEQIHSTNIEIVRSTTKDKFIKIEDTDGIITKEKKLILTVVTADCCPIIFADKGKEIIGIAHLGWRGSVKRMSEKMVNKMILLGSNINDIKVAIGPSIGQCCYDIDDDRYLEFREEFDGYSEQIFKRYKGKWHLNLLLLNYLLLVDLGIKFQNIDYFPFCTKCDRERFFSFRREKKGELLGEMFSFIINT